MGVFVRVDPTGHPHAGHPRRSARAGWGSGWDGVSSWAWRPELSIGQRAARTSRASGQDSDGYLRAQAPMRSHRRLVSAHEPRSGPHDRSRAGPQGQSARGSERPLRGADDLQVRDEPGGRRRRPCSTSGATVPFVARYRKEVTGRPGRRPAAHAAGAAGVPARAGGAPRAVSRVRCASRASSPTSWRPRSCGADTKARLEDVYLPLQAEAPHQGADRPRGRAGAAGRRRCSPTPRTTRRGTGRGLRGCREGRRRRRRGAGGRPGDPRRAVRRGRRPRRPRCASAGWTPGGSCARCARPRGRAARSSPTTSTRPRRTSELPVAPDPGDVARARRRACSTSSSTLPGRRTRPRRRSTQPTSGGGGTVRHRDQGGRATSGSRDAVRWAWRTRMMAHLRHRPAHASCGRRPRTRPIACSRANLARPAAGGPGRHPRHDGARPGPAHRREGGRGRRDRQGRGDRHDLPARARTPLGRRAPRAGGVWCARHDVELIAIGNGTASPRDRQARRRAASRSTRDRSSRKVMVSEAGASVYSASELAREGAARPRRHAARRGLDRAPPAGSARRAGEDRSEVDRRRPVPARRDRARAVAQSLDARGRGLRERGGRRPEHRVGAAAARGRRASSRALAEQIVEHRDANGPFRSRADCCKVARLGPKAFEQCAGFLRIRGGEDPLDVLRRAPRGLPGGAEDRRDGGRRPAGADRRRLGAAAGASRGLRRRPFGAADRRRHPRRSWTSPGAIRARPSDGRASPRASRPSPTCARAWCSRAWSPT